MGQREGYKATLEWGFWKFVKYLIVTTIISLIAGWALTRLAQLDILVAMWHLANPAVFIPETLCAMAVTYILYLNWKSNKKKKLEDARIKRLIAEID